MDANNVLADLTLDDVVIKHDVLKNIQEYPVKDLKHKDLCAVCIWLKIKGVKNTSKESMLEKLVCIYKLKEQFGRLKDDTDYFLTMTRKEPQCPYRLLNILFSDMFCEGLGQLRNVADRFKFDAGKESNNQLFWEGIQEAFTSPSELIDNFHFEAEVLSDLNHINFKKIVLHDWKSFMLCGRI